MDYLAIIGSIPDKEVSSLLDDRRLRYAFCHIKDIASRTTPEEMRNVRKDLERDPSFLNPHALQDMMDSLGVELSTCSLLKHIE